MRLDGVGKRYGLRQPWIVRDVSLEIQAGRLVRLEGINGSGKSTLLRVIAGVSAPSSGKMTGRPTVGYVPERFPPALPFTARDYLTHLGRVHGVRGEALARRIDQCLDQLGGAEYAGVPLRNLSKGMCQKVAVAQALLPRPGLLVLDEAWTGLDTAARAALDGAVAERLADGGAVVFVDHDPRRLAMLAHQRWQVAHGRVTALAQAAGGPAEEPAGGTGQPGVGAQSGGAGGAGGAAGFAGTGGAGGAVAPAIVIELSGWPQDLLPPGGLAGVLSARRDGDYLVVVTDPAASDGVLRALLAGGNQVHVSAVYEQSEGEQ